jgi:hypothetical protein
MLKLLSLSFLITLFLPMVSAPAEPKSLKDAQDACAMAATKDYLNANLALLNQTPLMSIDGAIAQRRLEEQYCLRFAQCLMDGSPLNQIAVLQYQATFSSCLRDETLEHYGVKSE